MLQKEYYYVGYALWFSLFVGSFVGMSGAISSLWLGKEPPRASLKLVTGLLGFFVVVCSGYLLAYYFRNGVWL